MKHRNHVLREEMKKLRLRQENWWRTPAESAGQRVVASLASADRNEVGIHSDRLEGLLSWATSSVTRMTHRLWVAHSTWSRVARPLF